MILATCNTTRYPACSPIRAARPRCHKSSLALAVPALRRHCCRCSYSSAASDVQYPPITISLILSNAQAFFITLPPPFLVSYSAPVGSVVSAYLHGSNVDPGQNGIPSARTSPCSFYDSASPMPQQATRQWWSTRHGIVYLLGAPLATATIPRRLVCRLQCGHPHRQRRLYPLLARVFLETLQTIMSSIHSPLCLLRAALLLFRLFVAAFPTSLQQLQHPQHSGHCSLVA